MLRSNDQARPIVLLREEERGWFKSRFVDPSYFNDSRLLTHTRECSGCQSELWAIGGGEIELEYLSQEFVFDTEIQRFSTHWKRAPEIEPAMWCEEWKNFDCRNLTAHTTQEYYWKFYLARKWPDIVIRFATLMHDAGRFTEIEFKRNFRYQIQLILDYAPRETKVYWMTGLSFAPENGTTQWPWMKRWNEIAVRLIERHGEGRIVVVPMDLYEIKAMFVERFPGKLLHDLAHMDQPWYDRVMAKIWPWIQCHYDLHSKA